MDKSAIVQGRTISHSVPKDALCSPQKGDRKGPRMETTDAWMVQALHPRAFFDGNRYPQVRLDITVTNHCVISARPNFSFSVYAKHILRSFDHLQCPP